jgi:hypothetical protein
MNYVYCLLRERQDFVGEYLSIKFSEIEVFFLLVFYQTITLDVIRKYIEHYLCMIFRNGV